MRNTTVLISGASIAGPALALWLARYGCTVTVVEKSPTLRRGGQAVDFTGTTHHTVLERMGVLADIRRRQTGKTDTVLHDGSGRRRAVISGDFTGGDIEILRGDLADILYRHTADHCEYRFGDTVTALTDTAEGVHVEFEHAPPQRFDLVIGCDGMHSRIRRLAFGPESDFVAHKGYYYAIAGASPWESPADGPRERAVAHGWNTPGRLATSGGSKAAQLYLFAAPRLDCPRDDLDAQRRLLADRFAGMGGEVPRMLAELPGLDGFYFDSLSKVTMPDYTRGRVALAGDAAHGNTLAGFGTGLAVVGAYVLAGELLTAAGDHTVAFPRYQKIMKRHAKLADGSHPGRFLAPKTALGLRFRNWFLGSRGMDLTAKYADHAKNDIELQDYPAFAAAHDTEYH
ncbi:FAD-dependent monooxygenase [Nocardia sp. alder85J]|uniref:FAD-dependent monooxygenase n=1 Tax=Nocardia sp. alder85J TaxID=2862949 RepID=UPI001CD7417A|nr:FAD-dependent monooxygenase [Nocardia sp. alder85J]MCX4096105.1 FAD-dependent monooxygenase [Nocardia sp. alder85J]